jgi:hypothetical protein
MRPKISDNPADTMNRREANVRLLNTWTRNNSTV